MGIQDEQPVDPDCSHRPEVADVGSIHQADQNGGEAIAETLKNSHRTRLAVAPRSNDQLEQPRPDGRHHPMKIVRIVRAIAVEENSDTISSRARARQAGSSVATPRFAHHLGAGSSRLLGGPIARAVIDDDNAVVVRIQDFAQARHQPANCRLLVQTRNDDSQS